MRVGILGGTGPLGRGLALRLAAAGVHIDIGSRDAFRGDQLGDELRQLWPERSLPIEGGANAAAADADMVIAATPWEGAVATVRELEGQLNGKVVVSVGNALMKQGREMLALIPPRGSVAGELQAALPGSTVSAACHHLPAKTLAALDAPLAADVLVCSDSAEARQTTMDLLAMVEGLRPLDAGTLASASAVEAFTAVLIGLNIRYKAHSTLRLGGITPAP